MKFPTTYPKLGIESVELGDYKLVPIRYEDQWDIMKWRNEQIYHLRQQEPLTKEKQEIYFQKVVAQIFEDERPNQVLFSYLKGDECVGYGGLVHINWADKNAEISFIINTKLEKEEFKLHWGNYLKMLEKISFEQLDLHKIYTYAFDLRPHLYEAVESVGFTKEAVLKEHCYFGGKFKDVVIHSKYNNSIAIRPIDSQDMDFTFLLSNDSMTRKNSYQTEEIAYSSHKSWFQSKIEDSAAFYFIGEFNRKSVAFLRIDRKEKENVIGIALHEDCRGKKLSSSFLKEITKAFNYKYPGEKVIAYIKSNNIASIKAFEKAGFTFCEEIKIKSIPTKKYRYE